MISRILTLLFLLPTLGFGQWINESWEPALGVPRPPIGITNSVLMYHPDYERTYDYSDDGGTGAVVYRTTGAGVPYTYYVDNTAVGATDTANTHGSPTTPRLTWPWPLSAGDVVYVHAGMYSFNNGASSTLRLGGEGTEAAPIFIHGNGIGGPTNTMAGWPVINKQGLMHGKWTIFEGFAFTNHMNLTTRNDLYASSTTNYVVRSNLFLGPGTASTASGVANSSGSASQYVKNLVVMWNHFERLGNYTNATENDAVATIFRDYSTNCWFGENYVYRMGGDMIRVGSNQDNDLDNGLTAFHYVFRNYCAQSGENAVDVKKAWGSVISENTFEDFNSYVPSGGDAAISIHYNPNHTWFINNVIRDCNLAISTGSRMQATNAVWLIGNKIYDASDSGVYWRGSFTNYAMNNLFYNAVIGFRVSTSGSGQFNYWTNNLISESSSLALSFGNSGARSRAGFGFNNYHNDAGLSISWSATYGTVSAWDTAIANVASETELDPGFVSDVTGDFRITEGSAMRGAGTDWTAFADNAFNATFGFTPDWVDLDGTAIDTSPDVGAYQYSAESPAPDAPSSLAATNISPTRNDISWTDNADNESGFALERSATGGGSGFEQLALIAPSSGTGGTVTYQDLSVLPGETWFYRARAYHSTDASAYTSEDSATSATITVGSRPSAAIATLLTTP